jgi:hypothetical protein
VAILLRLGAGPSDMRALETVRPIPYLGRAKCRPGGGQRGAGTRSRPERGSEQPATEHRATDGAWRITRRSRGSARGERGAPEGMGADVLVPASVDQGEGIPLEHREAGSCRTQRTHQRTAGSSASFHIRPAHDGHRSLPWRPSRSRVPTQPPRATPRTPDRRATSSPPRRRPSRLGRRARCRAIRRLRK